MDDTNTNDTFNINGLNADNVTEAERARLEAIIKTADQQSDEYKSAVLLLQTLDERAQNQDDTPSPYVTAPILTDEQQETIQDLRDAYDKKKYLKTASSSLSVRQIEDTMALSAEEREKALLNPDNLIAVYEFYHSKKNLKDASLDDKRDTIASDVDIRLERLKAEDITPENAYSYLLLSQYTSNPILKDNVCAIIATALKNYDNERFGSLSADEFLKNYNTAKASFSEHLSDEDKAKFLKGYAFTDDNGKPLEGKKLKKTEETLLSMAMERAALSCAKTGKTDEASVKSALKQEIDILLYDPSGERTFSETRLAGALGAAHTDIDSLRERSAQKFGKKHPLSKALTQNLAKVDKELTKRYGKKYEIAKKYTKLIAKIGWGAAKSTALFTAAGMIPPPGIGTAALITYNTCKQWKTMSRQLTDPSISKPKKIAMLLGSGATTVLGAATAAAGLDGVMTACGLNSPGFIQGAANITSHLAAAGRVGISAVAATIPNWVEKYSLKIKTKRLKKQLAKETDPAIKKSLTDRLQLLEQKKQQNTQELVTRGLGVAIGSALAFSGVAQAAVNKGAETLGLDHAASDAIHALQKDNYVENQTGEQAAQPEAEKPVHDRGVPDGVQGRQDANLEAAQTGEHAAQTGEQTPKTGEQAAQPEAEKPVHDRGVPDGVHGKQASNLEAAKAESSSGIEGKSAYAHTLQHLESLNDSRIEDTQAMANNLADHFGAKANLATIACKMAPHALQDVLKLDNLPNSNPTSYNMLNALANNELTAEQQTALNQFLEEHFDGTRFKTENFDDYRSTQHTTAATRATTATTATTATAASATEQSAAAAANGTSRPMQHIDVPPTGNKVADFLNERFACSDDPEHKYPTRSGYTFTPVDHVPGHPSAAEQQSSQQAAVHHQPPAQTSHEQAAAAAAVTYQQNSPEWFEARGYVRSARFEVGLGLDGDYQHAYYVPGTAGRDLQVVLVSDDPHSTNPVQTRLAQDLAAEQRGHYGNYRCPEYMAGPLERQAEIARYQDAGYAGYRSLSGGGTTSYAPTTVDRVVNAVNAISAGTVAAHEVLDVVAHARHVFR